MLVLSYLPSLSVPPSLPSFLSFLSLALCLSFFFFFEVAVTISLKPMGRRDCKKPVTFIFNFFIYIYIYGKYVCVHKCVCVCGQSRTSMFSSVALHLIDLRQGPSALMDSARLSGQ